MPLAGVRLTAVVRLTRLAVVRLTPPAAGARRLAVVRRMPLPAGDRVTPLLAVARLLAVVRPMPPRARELSAPAVRERVTPPAGARLLAVVRPMPLRARELSAPAVKELLTPTAGAPYPPRLTRPPEPPLVLRTPLELPGEGVVAAPLHRPDRVGIR
jgi:hypothetical protein